MMLLLPMPPLRSSGEKVAAGTPSKTKKGPSRRTGMQSPLRRIRGLPRRTQRREREDKEEKGHRKREGRGGAALGSFCAALGFVVELDLVVALRAMGEVGRPASRSAAGLRSPFWRKRRRTPNTSPSARIVLAEPAGCTTKTPLRKCVTAKVRKERSPDAGSATPGLL